MWHQCCQWNNTLDVVSQSQFDLQSESSCRHHLVDWNIEGLLGADETRLELVHDRNGGRELSAGAHHHVVARCRQFGLKLSFRLEHVFDLDPVVIFGNVFENRRSAVSDRHASERGDTGSEDSRRCRVELEVKAQIRAFRVDERVSKGRHGKDNLVVT